ncbi:hypothetical protein OIU85_011352 [Salix viminalis]|uniref:Uncharacterized protein n=1 Tax=Salix viminalis TaxID=40686 RepID=A0A9Q0NSM3_SALVM|nr:hypothetical protein OIU85_011352 [Salix viminalis]
MATTLGLLKFPILSQKNNTPFIHSKMHLLSNSSKLDVGKKDSHSPRKLFTETIQQLSSASLAPASLALPFFLDTKDALAVGGEYGILEGKVFGTYPPHRDGWFVILHLVGWIFGVAMEAHPVEAAPSPVELKIQQLTEERKELIKGSYRDRHFNAGSILLGFGVFEAIGGGVNTWLRTGKLFPGPHLFAGAGITVLWAAAAALVPAMQKGNETARNLHIALNAVNVVLFLWQIPTGIDIVFKVFEFTKWP